MVDEENRTVAPVPDLAPDLAILPTDLWDAAMTRQAKLDARMRRQAAANASGNNCKGLGAARRNRHPLTPSREKAPFTYGTVGPGRARDGSATRAGLNGRMPLPKAAACLIARHIDQKSTVFGPDLPVT
jgi:hypothetical protein